MANDYQICTRCVMDTSDPEISFDAQGRCNHCRAQKWALLNVLPQEHESEDLLSETLNSIKASGGREYDCVLGLSGGVDSSYVALLAKEAGLRPLLIHMDNGWNSELAVKNIEQIVSVLGFDLYTHVVDWEEFRDLQRSMICASVVDIEMLTDHALTALAYRQARKVGTHFILSGINIRTEGIMPEAWTHRKSDLRNIKAIHRRYGKASIRTFPTAGTIRLRTYEHIFRIKRIDVLNLINYRKDRVIPELQEKLGWRPYPGKHDESLFTRFYQRYILPEKFGIDKRRAHLSCLICSGEKTRDEALQELDELLYDDATLALDKEYVLKKLGFTENDFDRLMKEPQRDHSSYPSEESYLRPMNRLRSKLKTFQVQ